MFFLYSVVPFLTYNPVSNQYYLSRLLSAFTEGPFRGRLELSSFLGVDIGFFLFALLFCDYSMALFLVIDVESLFERFHSISFQYSPFFIPYVIFMSILIPNSFFFPLVYVPENLYFSLTESALLGSCGI